MKNNLFTSIKVNRINFHDACEKQQGYMDIYHINNHQLDFPIKNYMSSWQLHQILDIKTDYHNWIKEQISYYDLIPLYEYIAFPVAINLLANETEIFISFDIAMALCRFLRTEKSRLLCRTLQHFKHWCIHNGVYDYYITGNYKEA